MSITYGQRGWNTQPTGSIRRSGGEPGMPVIYRRGPCSAGNEFSSPSVYGWRGARKSSSAAARSTRRPAYITAIESAISASSDRSCVMNRTAKPSRSRSAVSSSRISRWVTTSSAVVGSSRITTWGSSARAIAIMTRCRIPPDSSCGKLLSRSAVMPTMASSSAARARRAAASRLATWASRTSVSWTPTDSTGFSAFIADWSTTAIWDQRSRRSSGSSRSSRSTGRPGSAW